MRLHRNKYGAKKVELDGIRFDSKREAARYVDLKLMERAGHIARLTVHPVLPLAVNGVKIGKYTPDFRYEEGPEIHFEDVKGVMTRDAALRIKLAEAIYGITVEIVR